MPSRRAVAVPSAALACASVLALAGCDGPTPADLFLVQRTGTIPGARLTLRLTDDGGAFCNAGKRQELTSAQLITARALRRALDGEQDQDVGLAEKHIDLPPGAVTTLRYKVRSENGTVAFSDTSAHQPQAFYRLAQLTREVAREDCHLPR
jgi:hypothetical protein